jgi:Transcription factor WhiB
MIVTSSPRRGRARRTSRPQRAMPAELTDEQLSGVVMSPLASCSTAAIDPDQWFPVATTATAARAEATPALALCALCPVRAECLELSLRHWETIGRHGIWGGLVETERAVARRQWIVGAEVALLCVTPAGPAPVHRSGRAMAAARRSPGPGPGDGEGSS